jgi:hypothetical protein
VSRRAELVLALSALASSLLFAAPADSGSGPVVTVTHPLAGLNDSVSGGYEPPDVSVAAGRGYVVELVNLAERVWTTTGDAPFRAQTRSLALVFGTGSDRLTDPRVLYDAPSDRFFASVSDIDRSAVLLAVTSTDDPTGTWTVSTFRTRGCADQPRVGVADEIVVVSADVFDGCELSDSGLLGAELWTVNKAQLVAGSTMPDMATFGPTATYTSLTPAQSLSPTATAYVVSVDQRASRVAHLLTVDGVPPAAVNVQEVAAPAITPLLRPPPAAQPPVNGVPPPLSTNDNRVLDAVWENGALWFTANARCSPPGDPLIRSCGRVVELTTATRTVAWETDLGVPGAHVFYPAARPDGRGNLVVVAGESGVSIEPRLVVFARTADGVVTPPTVIAKSADTYRGDRYGDYFGAARDPVDGALVWVGGEAGVEVSNRAGWSTDVASVVVTPAGATPPAVAGIVPPRVRALGAAVRKGSAVTLSYRALGDSDAVQAIVTVQNAKHAFVYRTTTRRAAVRAMQRYDVLWPAKKSRGSFTFCVQAQSITGLQSPRSCAAIRVR